MERCIINDESKFSGFVREGDEVVDDLLGNTGHEAQPVVLWRSQETGERAAGEPKASLV